jgi:hypothetical protein
MNLNIFGALALAVLVAAGVALIVLGIVGIRKADTWMLRGLGILAVGVGAAYFVILAVAIALHREPWTPMLTLLAVGAGIAALIFWVGALADCLLNEPNDGWGKLVWVLAIVFTFVIGAGIYYLGQRPRRLARAKE